MPRPLMPLLCCLLAVLCLQAAAPVSGGPRGELSFRAYGAEQGLKGQGVWALAQDSTGFLWAGTEEGLYRYDGRAWKAFGIRDGLPSSFVEGLQVDDRGDLWAATYHGLARLDRGRFRTVEPSQGLPAQPVTALASGAGFPLWVGTQEGPFRLEADGRFHRASGWPGGAVTALWTRPGVPFLYAAARLEGRTRLFRFEGARWAAVAAAPRMAGEKIDALAVDGRGGVWARSAGTLFRRLPGEGCLAAVPAPPMGQKGHLYVDGSGRLWVPSVEGLLRQGNGGLERMGVREGFPAALLRAVFEDREGSLWVAGEGLYRQQGGGALKGYTTRQGLPDNAVWTIHRDRRGRLLVGTGNGLAEAAGAGWRLVPGTRHVPVRTISEGPDGALFLAGGAEILRLAPSGALQRFGPAQGVLTAGRIYRLLFDAEGILWAATDGGGLLRGEGRGARWTFRREEIPGGDAHERFEGLAMDAAGRLWAAGSRGLALRDGGHWQRFTSRHGLRADHVSYVRPLRSGEMLLAYYDPLGVCRLRYEQGGLQVLGHLDGLLSPDLSVYLMGEDASGRVWIGSGGGLEVVGRDGRTEHFGRSEGMPSENTNAMAFLAEPGGDVWIGTAGGLVRYDASARRAAALPPATVLMEVRLGGKAYDPQEPAPLQVPRRANTLEVRYASPSYLHERDIQHETRLLGLESAWHRREGAEERYAALPPGRYRLEVRSRAAGGPWGPTASLDFVIRPAWWETWWARGLMGIAAVAALLALLRLRLAALHHRTRVLEGMVAARTREVEAKARELEAANGALRNQSLTDTLTGLRNRSYLGVCMPEDVAQVTRLHRSAAPGRLERLALNIDMVFLMIDVDHFKMVNDRFGHAGGDLVLQQVAELIRGATRDTDTVVRWGGEEFLVVARNAARQDAAVLAERIRAAVSAHPFDVGEREPLHRTCSLGFACFPLVPEQPALLGWEQVVDLADHCLYAAKRSGRDAWVGVLAAEGGDPQAIWRGVPNGIPALLAEGHLEACVSPGVVGDLDWSLGG